MERVKNVVFGARHTGQGPLGRAWGRTSADLPDLQPVVIYEREIKMNEVSLIVEAWILSLDPRFEYMRPSMYRHASAFMFTFEATELRAKARDQLASLDPFIAEIDAMDTGEASVPRVLVATWMDPTLPRIPCAGSEHVQSWMKQHRIDTCVEIDMNGQERFVSSVENAMMTVARLAVGRAGSRPGLM